MCSTVTTGEFRSWLRAAVRRGRRRRKRSQTGQESVTFDRPGQVCQSQPILNTGRADASDGDVDPDCQCQFAFEPVLPTGRDGMRFVRASPF